MISKRGTKAYGRELARLTWPGDRIRWLIGTGDPATFRPKSEDSTLSVLDGYLPVATGPLVQRQHRLRRGGLRDHAHRAALFRGPVAQRADARGSDAEDSRAQPRRIGGNRASVAADGTGLGAGPRKHAGALVPRRRHRARCPGPPRQRFPRHWRGVGCVHLYLFHPRSDRE